VERCQRRLSGLDWARHTSTVAHSRRKCWTLSRPILGDAFVYSTGDFFVGNTYLFVQAAITTC